MKEKKINRKVVKSIIFWGIIGAMIGALIAQKMNVNLLRKLFGIFLGFIAIHEIYILFKEYIFDKKGKDKRKE